MREGEREDIAVNRHLGTVHTYWMICSTVQYICTEWQELVVVT